MSIRLVLLQVSFFSIEDGSQSKYNKDGTRTLFHDASVCALSIGIHALRCRIGPDWSALLLCFLSRGVMSVERRRTKASLAVIASAGNVG
jgi:hypothetical protein